MTLDAAIVGIGLSPFGRGLPDSQLGLAATAFKAALADAGLERADVDGLSIHLGWPLGPDYDRIAEAFGLDIRYVNQSWLQVVSQFECGRIANSGAKLRTSS